MSVIEMQQEQTSAQVKNHRVRVFGADIFVHERGQGMPVLYLHGSPDSHDMWLPLINESGDNQRHIAIDLPGFGQSTLPDSFSLSLDHMADFVEKLLDNLYVDEPVTLVTNDFGVHYGLAFTVKYPDRVRGVAISNSNFFRDYKWHFFAGLYRLPVIGDILVGTASRGMMSQTLKSVAPAMPDDYIDRSYDSGFGSKKVRKTILRMYRERSSGDFAGWDDKLLEILKTTPAIVLWGDKDPFITPDYAERFKGAEIHHFSEYSHWIPLEAPDLYADKLHDWFASI